MNNVLCVVESNKEGDFDLSIANYLPTSTLELLSATVLLGAVKHGASVKRVLSLLAELDISDGESIAPPVVIKGNFG